LDLKFSALRKQKFKWNISVVFGRSEIQKRERGEREGQSLVFGVEERVSRETKCRGTHTYFTSLHKCEEIEWRHQLFSIFHISPWFWWYIQ